MEGHTSLFFSATVTNMASEMFSDALFFRKQSQDSCDEFVQWRYYRASIIYFCISAEAWINSLLRDALKTKDNLDPTQVKLRSALGQDSEIMPRGVKLTIHAKLYEHLPRLWKYEIDSSLDDALKRFLELSKLRNRIVHYSKGSYAKVYDTSVLEDAVNTASLIIRTMFQKMSIAAQGTVSRNICPEWFDTVGGKHEDIC